MHGENSTDKLHYPVTEVLGMKLHMERLFFGVKLMSKPTAGSLPNTNIDSVEVRMRRKFHIFEDMGVPFRLSCCSTGVIA